MESWKVGEAQVYLIPEQYGALFDAKTFFPDFDESKIDQLKDWLSPRFYDLERHRLIASIHSFLIQTPHHNVLIDTCVGNDKNRMPYRDWHQMQTPWLSKLKATGVSPDDIDFVMCTHLHVDHVGWNTCLKDGNWVPTFPNAKYLFSQIEFDFWQAQRRANQDTFSEVNNLTFDDSVMPILHLAQMIEEETMLLDGMLNLALAPGHTPGSITAELSDKGQKALFTGDILHHPIQVAEPDWNSAYCELPDAARQTRKRVLDHCASTDCLLMPAHFADPYCGRIISNSAGYQFSF